MFNDRIDEIKPIIGKDFVTLTEDPEVILIDDFLSPLDITYLLDEGKKLTESISEKTVDTYRLSPYRHDFIKLIASRVSQIVNKPLENLYYINLYNQIENSRLFVSGFTLPKIQESTIALSPNGKIETIGILSLSEASFTVCSVPVSTKPGSLILAKTVDVNPETCNNSILGSSTLTGDAWYCTFMFTEHPREINEVIL